MQWCASVGGDLRMAIGDTVSRDSSPFRRLRALLSHGVQRLHLFGHLPAEGEERARAVVALAAFGVLIGVGWLWIPASRRSQEERFEDQFRGVTQSANYLASSGIGLEGKDNPWFDQQVRQLFHELHGKWPRSPADEYEVRQLAERFDAMAKTTAEERHARVKDFEEAAQQIVLNQYPLVDFAMPLQMWLYFGSAYWLTIFLLYGFVMIPTIGEPIFNVLDIAFLSVLIEFSGSISSPFFLLFAASLFLSAADFCYQIARGQYDGLRPIRRAVQLLIPYVLAVFLHLFWAVGREVMLRHISFREFADPAVRLLISGVFIWLFFFVIFRFALSFAKKIQRASAR
jgi:hypothetical protein